MVKRLSSFVAWMLLVLMPLQALAAASLMACHQPVQSSEQSTMPCHATDDTVNVDKTSEVQHQACKVRCAAVAASVYMLTVDVQVTLFENYAIVIDGYHNDYASIARQRLQRPPISFI